VRLTVAAWFDPVCLKCLDDALRVEILHRHAQVVDGGARGVTRSAAARGACREHQELDAAAEPEHRAVGP